MSTDTTVEQLKKQLEQEKTLKIQAINKLVERMNQKDQNSKGGKSNPKLLAEIRKLEKQNRKLQLELKQVKVTLIQIPVQ